jgi:hypothetical protein
MMRYWKVALGAAATGFFAGPLAAADDYIMPKQPPECAANPSFSAADFSVPLTRLLTKEKLPALGALKAFGVDTVFRYYDHIDETLPEKTLLAAESDAIIAAGLKIGVVFQHHNDDPAKFLDPESGTRDAERALMLADDNRQPYGSAIYFGVDGPERHLDTLLKEYKRDGGKPMSASRKQELRKHPGLIASYGSFLRFGPDAFHLDDLSKVTPDAMKPVVARYFHSIQGSFAKYSREHAGNGYKIGMYCTAAMCLLGDDDGLAEFFWISPEGRNDPEYKQFLQRSDRWTLVQQRETSCPGWGPTPDRQELKFDFDQVSGKHPDFGQWAAKRAPM